MQVWHNRKQSPVLTWMGHAYEEFNLYSVCYVNTDIKLGNKTKLATGPAQQKVPKAMLR